MISYLLPHLTGANKAPGTSSTAPTSGTSSSTVTAALVQRTKLLQEENDELFELLKSGETGKLKEEVRGLRKVVDRLEQALKGGVLYRPDACPSLTTITQSPTRLSRRSRESSFVLKDLSHCSSPATAFFLGPSSIRHTMSSTLQTAGLQTPITTLTLPQRCVMAFLRVLRLPVVANRPQRVPERTRSRDCLNRLPRVQPPSTLTLTHAKTLGHVQGLTTIESMIEIPSSARHPKMT